MSFQLFISMTVNWTSSKVRSFVLINGLKHSISFESFNRGDFPCHLIERSNITLTFIPLLKSLMIFAWNCTLKQQYLLADLDHWKTITIFSSLCSGDVLLYYFYMNINSALRCTVNQNPSVEIYWWILRRILFFFLHEVYSFQIYKNVYDYSEKLSSKFDNFIYI
jgi:hypothetical protein